jgi:hypothetical protein
VFDCPGGLEQPGRAVVGAGDRAVRAGRGQPDGRPGTRRRRRAGLVAQAGRLRRAARRARGDDRPLRRAALPLQLQLPRRCEPPRGAGGAGGPPRAGGDRAHRPRRRVRRGALRGGRGGAGRGDGVRHRALAGPVRSAERRGRPGGRPPPAARHRTRRLPRALPRGQRCAVAGSGEGAPGLRPRRGGRRHRGRGRGAHRLPQGRGPPRPGHRGRPGHRAAPPRRALRRRPRRRRALPLRPADGTSERNAALPALARDAPCPPWRPTGAHYATPGTGTGWHMALAAVPRARRSLERWTAAAAGGQPRTCGRWAEDGGPVRRRAPRRRRAGGGAGAGVRVPRSGLVAPDLPRFETPPGHTDELAARAGAPGDDAPRRQPRRGPAAIATTWSAS